MGTALGDWLADTRDFGYERGAIVFGAALLVVVALYFWTGISRVALFWAAFILTRPLGATVGDFLDEPVTEAGLALRRPLASAAFAAVMVVLIMVLPQRPGRHPSQSEGRNLRGSAVNEEQRNAMASRPGFIAALDQSGGSSPKALKLYGISADAYDSDEKMFDLIHEMRERIMSSPSFSGDQVLATILFEQTMDRTIEGQDTAAFLWEQKRVVPFVKVDQGLDTADNGVQLMKPMTKLDSVLDRAVENGIFGTKMRSFIQEPNHNGIKAIVDQQFDYAYRIAERGLMPIIEPEVSIKSPDKPKADDLLLAALRTKLDEVPGDTQVMLKLTLPCQDNLYTPLIQHPRVLRVVALSGGYSLAESCAILSRNHGLIASFSRALTEGLTVDQTDAQFDARLGSNIEQIYAASLT